MNNQNAQGPTPNKVITWTGIIMIVLAALLLIAGMTMIHLAEEYHMSQAAVSGSFIIFLAFFWESVLMGISGVVIFRHPYERRWGLSIASAAVFLIGNLFSMEEVGLWVAGILVGSALGILGLGVGLAASLHD